MSKPYKALAASALALTLGLAGAVNLHAQTSGVTVPGSPFYLVLTLDTAAQQAGSLPAPPLVVETVGTIQEALALINRKDPSTRCQARVAEVTVAVSAISARERPLTLTIGEPFPTASAPRPSNVPHPVQAGLSHQGTPVVEENYCVEYCRELADESVTGNRNQLHWGRKEGDACFCFNMPSPKRWPGVAAASNCQQLWDATDGVPVAVWNALERN